MNTRDSLLAAIEAFCEQHGMSETAFGLAAAKDGHLVRHIRQTKATLKRIEKVEQFMKNYRPVHDDAGAKLIPSREKAA